MRKRSIFLPFLVVGFLVILTTFPTVSGHSVQTDWEIGRLKVTAWYGGGDPMKDAIVKVYTSYSGTNELYENGKMNENGVFFFTPKARIEDYKVIVQSPGGHKDDLTINLGDKSVEGDGSEMPLYTRIAAGFGYLIGLAGIAFGYLGWRKKKEHEEE